MRRTHPKKQNRIAASKYPNQATVRSRSSPAPQLRSSSEISPASASDEVAAGEGALRTCIARSVRWTTKSSTSLPSRLECLRPDAGRSEIGLDSTQTWNQPGSLGDE